MNRKNDEAKLSKVIGRFVDGAKCEGPGSCDHPAAWVLRANPEVIHITHTRNEAKETEEAHAAELRLLTEEGSLLCSCCYGSFLIWQMNEGNYGGGNDNEAFWSMDMVLKDLPDNASDEELAQAMTERPDIAERAKKLVTPECLMRSLMVAMEMKRLRSDPLQQLKQMLHEASHQAHPIADSDAGTRNREIEQLMQEKAERDARLDALWGNDDVTLSDLGLGDEPLN